jgi:NADH-quinone oxidoreductase subunit J
MDWITAQNWFTAHWLLVASLALAALGVWWLMPSSWPRSNVVGVILALAGCGLLASRLDVTAGPLTESILFWMFASAALVAAVLMITSRNPVYAALWFALVTLSTCGLFLLQSAPFLAAATIIVYAGAIVVTFLFVMMLAQQSGATVYDQRSRQPLAATIAAFLLLGALLYTLAGWSTQVEAGRTMNTAAATANPLSRPPAEEPIDTMHALGRSLFGDYLFAVELAGTVLMIAAVGAIAMAPRRPEGTL